MKILKWGEQFGKRMLLFIKQHQKYLLLAPVSLYLTAVGLLVWSVFAPQTVQYDFGSTQNCSVSPRIFPELLKVQNEETFTFNRESRKSIGSIDIYSHKLCATAQQAPQESKTHASRERFLGISLLSNSMRATTLTYSQASSSLTERQLLAPSDMLRIELTKPDRTFTYIAKTADKTVPCVSDDKAFTCNLEPLQLAYAQDYDVKIERVFKDSPVSVMATAPIKTLTPVTIKTTSIPAGTTAQDKPTQAIIETDKKLTDIGEVTLVTKNSDATETAIPSTATIENTAVKVVFGKELPRKTSYEVRVASLKAEDGSGLTGKSYVLPFSTSGGPKVTGANIGTRDVAQNQQITLAFDQTLLATQDLAPAINFTVSGQPQPVNITVQGQKVLIKPANPLPLCATFSIKLNSGVQNQFGVSGDSAWSINSRAVCHVTFSIGTSVQGRPITAHKFGSGSNPIVYIGGTHGSEANSKAIMDLWFKELVNNPDRLTARSLVIIPSINPDGIAAGTRPNANQIDLNRNFPAADWKSMVTSPRSSTPTPAGGPQPLSEPESKAVASYIQQVQPRLVFSFHSAAGIVEANEAGDSVSIAASYASAARYRAVPRSQSNGIFQYDTTGAMEDWMRTSLGKPAIVVELISRTADEFSKNRTALWNTVGL